MGEDEGEGYRQRDGFDHVHDVGSFKFYPCSLKPYCRRVRGFKEPEDKKEKIIFHLCKPTIVITIR